MSATNIDEARSTILTYVIASNDSIIEGLYILIEGKDGDILLRHSSGGSRSFWVPKSRVASSIETAKGRIIAGDRDYLQKQIGILSRENLKLLSSEAAESERADDLEATLETNRLSHHSEVLMYIVKFTQLRAFKTLHPPAQIFRLSSFSAAQKLLPRNMKQLL